LRCTGRTLRSEPSPHLAGEAALPSQYFKERHGTASVYRVWRSHPFFEHAMNLSARPSRWCAPSLALVSPKPAFGRRRMPGGPGRGCLRIGVANRTPPRARQKRVKPVMGPPFPRVRAGKGRAGPKQAADFRPRKPCLARHPRLLTPEPQGPCSLLGAFRRGGRVVECTALEMRHRCKPIGGSNPSLSANIIIRHNKTASRKHGRSV
jgi:hypothetical protein